MKLLFSICCLLLTVPFFAQVKVSGTVMDRDSNDPLIYASIIEDSTQNEVFTDLDGRFEITTKDSTASITFTYTGYQAKTLSISTLSLSDTIILEEGELLPDTLLVRRTCFWTAKEWEKERERQKQMKAKNND